MQVSQLLKNYKNQFFAKAKQHTNERERQTEHNKNNVQLATFLVLVVAIVVVGVVRCFCYLSFWCIPLSLIAAVAGSYVQGRKANGTVPQIQKLEIAFR